VRLRPLNGGINEVFAQGQGRSQKNSKSRFFHEEFAQG